MTALVTGASGFVGFWVVKKLLAAGHQVKVLLRQPPPPYLAALDVEVVNGDLRDRDSLQRALSGCRQLYHVAAHYKLWERDPGVFYAINVEATKNLLTLAGDNGLDKIVYTSSVATIKPGDAAAPATETSVATLADMVGHYKRSKFLAEQEVDKLCQQGLPAVIVNPSAPIGAYDAKPTPTGKIILDFLQRKMPAYLDTGLNLVAVEDVAAGHLLAAQYGQHGRRYILGNSNLRLIEIFRLLAEITASAAPKVRMPYWVAYLAGSVSESWAMISGKPPQVPLDGVRMARKYMFFDSTRAENELGYCPTPVTAALQRAVTWFYDNGYAQR